MSNDNNKPSKVEMERWKLKLQKEKAFKRKKKIQRIGLLKIVVWIGLFITPILYQYAYFNSLKNVTFSLEPTIPFPARMASMSINAQTNVSSMSKFDVYDLVAEVQEYANSFIEPLLDLSSGLNVTQAFGNVLINNTIIAPLSNFLGHPIANLSDLMTALRNYTVPREIIDPIYESVFKWEIPKLLPSSWDDLVYFYIGYEGIFPITNVNVEVDLIYGEPIRLIQSATTTLSKEESLGMSIKVATLVQGILQSTYRVLVNATYNSIIAGGFFFYEHIIEYLKTEFLDIGLWLSLDVYANLGILPINFNVKVDLIWAIKLFMEVYL